MSVMSPSPCVGQYITEVRVGRMQALTLAYLQIIGLVNSFVIMDNDRPDRNLCKEVNSTIYPTVGQTEQGLIRPIEQHRVEQFLILSELQPVNITACADPGADCSGCKKKPDEHKVCSNHYKVGTQHSLLYSPSRPLHCRSTIKVR